MEDGLIFSLLSLSRKVEGKKEEMIIFYLDPPVLIFQKWEENSREDVLHR